MHDAQVRNDEKLARALQAHEYNRAQGNHGRGNSGGGQVQHGANARHHSRNQDLELALEANPEAFVSVPMLYVQCTLNDVPLKAFVDTGAQMTVVSSRCLQRCKLAERIDTRFKGIAAGVGAARILGRVHLATIRFGAHTAVDVSLSVLEQNHGPDLLIGLDFLRKYQATIDLGRNALIIGGKGIPFVDADKKKE